MIVSGPTSCGKTFFYEINASTEQQHDIWSATENHMALQAMAAAL